MIRVHFFHKVEDCSAHWSSESIYVQLLSLRRSENNILLLLIWSSECTDWALEALYAWTILQDDLQTFHNLIQQISLLKEFIEMTLALITLVTLVRLSIYWLRTTHSSEQNHFSNFNALVELRRWLDFNTWATLKHMTRFFWDVVLTLVNIRKAQVIIQILTDTVNDINSQKEMNDNLRLYWKRRFDSFYEDDKNCSTKAIALAQNKQTIQVKHEAASDQVTQNKSSQLTKCLIQRKQKRSKRRERYCDEWWFWTTRMLFKIYCILLRKCLRIELIILYLWIVFVWLL